MATLKLFSPVSRIGLFYSICFSFPVMWTHKTGFQGATFTPWNATSNQPFVHKHFSLLPALSDNRSIFHRNSRDHQPGTTSSFWLLGRSLHPISAKLRQAKTRRYKRDIIKVFSWGKRTKYLFSSEPPSRVVRTAFAAKYFRVAPQAFTILLCFYFSS